MAESHGVPFSTVGRLPDVTLVRTGVKSSLHFPRPDKRDDNDKLALFEVKDARRGKGRINLLDESGAALEDGALIQRAFVRHLSGVERGWFIE